VRSDRIAKLEASLAADPNDPFTRYALALEWSAAGDMNRALVMLEELRTHSPDYVPAYHQLGILLERSGSLHRAREVYTEGIGVAQRLGDHHAAGEMREAMEGMTE
jgi:Tfp pilus assembly protein PilF